jgi:putative copper export protein
VFLSVHGTAILLWIHVLAACIWIGGQITLGMLIPLLREHPGLVTTTARRFQWMAWSAFGALIVTGLANIRNAGIGLTDLTDTPTGRTLTVKLVFVAASGGAAAIHAFVMGPRASSRPSRRTRITSAVLGVLSLLAAMAAALYGVILVQA